MMQIRRADQRGRADHGWLDSRHTFSFADYYDPDHLGFGPLRVINEDRVTPGKGFGMHGHRDMEIISYVLEGVLAHRDSLGTGSEIRPGDVQRMTAGTGIMHSEFNASETEPVHFLQIWILPERTGLEPGYEQKTFNDRDMRNQLRLIGSRDGRDGSLVIHRDVDLFAGRLDPDASVEHHPNADRKVWVQVARGQIKINGETLIAGDGAALSGQHSIAIQADDAAEVLVFDMA